MGQSGQFHRRSIRMKGYDYSQPGAYFVTLVSKHRECFFGEIVDGEMRPSHIGRLVTYAWMDLPRHFKQIRLDAFMLMPNHLHGIIWIEENADLSKPKNPALGAIIGTFKAEATRRVVKSVQAITLWQRNYYEHIIRNDKELEAIRRYILGNPVLWLEDEENPNLENR